MLWLWCSWDILRLWSEYLLESATGVTGALSLGTIRTPWRVCKTMGLGFGTNCKATTAQVVTHGDTHSSLVGAQSCGANSQVSVKQPQLGSLAKLIQYDSVWYSGSPWFSIVFHGFPVLSSRPQTVTPDFQVKWPGPSQLTDSGPSFEDSCTLPLPEQRARENCCNATGINGYKRTSFSWET